nr:hypothetical protein [Bradyrhizobium diazoefficiens]
MGNQADTRGTETDDEVIRDRRIERLQIGKIAGNVEGYYLLPIRGDLVARQKSAMHDCVPSGDLAFPAEGLAGFERLLGDAKRLQKLAVLLGKTNGIMDAFAEEAARHGEIYDPQCNRNQGILSGVFAAAGAHQSVDDARAITKVNRVPSRVEWTVNSPPGAVGIGEAI